MTICVNLAVAVSEYKAFYGIITNDDDAKIELLLATAQEYIESYLGFNIVKGIKCITTNSEPIINGINVGFPNYGVDTYYKIDGVLQPIPTVINGKLVDCKSGCGVSTCNNKCTVYEVCYESGYDCIPSCVITAILNMTNDLMGGSVYTSAGGLTGWTDKVGDLSHSETYDVGAVSQAVFGKLPNAVVECLKRLRKIIVYGL